MVLELGELKQKHFILFKALTYTLLKKYFFTKWILSKPNITSCSRCEDVTKMIIPIDALPDFPWNRIDGKLLSCRFQMNCSTN